MLREWDWKLCSVDAVVMCRGWEWRKKSLLRVVHYFVFSLRVLKVLVRWAFYVIVVFWMREWVFECIQVNSVNSVDSVTLVCPCLMWREWGL